MPAHSSTRASDNTTASPSSSGPGGPGRKALRDALAHEIGLLQDLVTLLQEENTVLGDGAQLDALAPITARKQRAYDALHAAGAQRNSALACLGLAEDGHGLEQSAAACPHIQKLVLALTALARQANQHNQENGRLISRFLVHNQQAVESLHVLLAGSARLYDARGRSAVAPLPATHIKAG